MFVSFCSSVQISQTKVWAVQYQGGTNYRLHVLFPASVRQGTFDEVCHTVHTRVEVGKSLEQSHLDLKSIPGLGLETGDWDRTP